MIERVTATRFDRPAGNGRTRPGFIVCQDVNGEDAEVVAKLAPACNRGATDLAMELVSACLAGDLGLPVPQPYLVQLDEEWIDTVADLDWAAVARAGPPLAFGSRRVPAGFGSWIAGTAMVHDLAKIAAGVLVFDSLTDNPDRRPANPNCLQRGLELRIIDHELCFGPLIIGWKPPWLIGSLQHLAPLGTHIFRDALHHHDVDWGPIIEAWKSLDDDTLASYAAAIPIEWASAGAAVSKAIEQVRNARDHIEACTVEVQRVLKC